MRASKVIFAAGLSTFSALCAPGCGAPPERVEPPIDCTAADSYDAPDPIPDAWFSATDGTGQVSCDDPAAAGQTPNAIGLCEGPRRAVATIGTVTFEADERCGSVDALHLTAARNNDWGGLFGNYGLATQTLDRSAYDGVGLWAKAAPGTTKTVTFILNDKYSINLKDDNNVPIATAESACVDEEGSGVESIPTQNPGQSGGGTAVTGYVPSPNACGNEYKAQLTVTEDWQFYFLPFEAFTQDPKPNRRIGGIDSSSLRGMSIRPPKAAVLDLLIDDLGYYAKIE